MTHGITYPGDVHVVYSTMLAQYLVLVGSVVMGFYATIDQAKRAAEKL